ncbi:ABC transporter permease [Piscinibacter sp.]|uniref:ABC transporter permease n=1 Tax=Piscinibacter sp. TaxID=1903157 RepID=UPI002B52EE94|nr:ABC transporter permease [Albitalea sp.]HUG25564.1 ABC transporter permease [Albitalea sp.]
MIFKKDIGLLVLILIVGSVVAIINPRFLLAANISNTANQIGLFGIIAIAQAFVILTGGIELSVGAIVALLGVLFIDLVVNMNVHWALAALIVIGAGMLMGLIHGALVAKAGMQPFVVTLCALLIYRGTARYYSEDATVGFGFGASFPMLEWLTAGRSEIFAPLARLFGHDGPTIAVPHTLIALAIVTVVAGVVLHRSVLGRYLFAVGKNEEAARYSGIATGRVTIAAYVICCGLTAFGAIVLAMYTRSIAPAVHGNFYELYAIAAAVLGGFSLRGGEGSIIGVVLGTILLQVLQNLVNLLGIPSSLNFAVMGSVILIGVLADQQFTRYRKRSLAQAPRPRAVAAPSMRADSSPSV